MSGLSQSGVYTSTHNRVERVLRFVGAGVINTLFGYAVFSGLVWSGMHPQLALAIQFTVGVLWNFQVHGRYVFYVQGYGRLPQYAVSYVVIYAFNAGLLWGLLQLGLDAYLAQAVALGPTVILSYALIARALRPNQPEVVQ
ncbi:GtrA family protein [Rhodobacteraceae bacterium B1Z28]|uniref:GtrA family protein n=1 Tax=Ruegeria haliotis TaxID=2747601 RepID=A0ABX2PQG9_9RHOB|nr:GtrA family protein [Ruegeria haliotis]NVO56379.1 GtrA family protein [Ruegeria haliotis]